MTFWIDENGAELPAFAAEFAPFHPIVALARWVAGSGWVVVAAVLVAAALAAVVYAGLRKGDRRFRMAAVAVAVVTSIALPLPVALLAFGAFSSVAALDALARDPSRRLWGLAIVTVSASIVGCPGGLLPLLVLVTLGAGAAVAAVAAARSVRSGTFAGASVVVAAIGLTAWWWIPALEFAGWNVTSSGAPATGLTGPASAERYAVAREQAGGRPSRSLLFDVDHVPAKIVRMSDAARPEIVRRVATPVITESGTRVVRVAEAPAWGLIAFGERWWPGWRVYWNGERLPPVVVNGDTVGSFVPPGGGVLSLRYRPDAFDTGLRVAGLGVLLSLTSLIWPWYRRIPTLPLDADLSIARRLSSRLASLPPRTAMLLGAVALVLYGAFLVSHRVTVAGGADPSGYLNQARRWLRGAIVVPVVPPAALQLPPSMKPRFVPLGFSPGPEDGTMVANYPPGLPLHYAAAARAAGERAFWFVTPIVSAVGILLMALLARELGFGWGAASAAASILALFPTFVMFALMPMSDSVATTWAIAAMLLAFRARRQWAFAAAAGAALGIGVLVRPTQILLLPALLTALGLRPRALAAFVMAGVPFAAVQMAIGSRLWGSPFRTGYGSIEPLLAWANVPVRFAHYTGWLTRLLSMLVFPIGLLGTAVPGEDRSVRAALALWFVPFFAFYCFYRPHEVWWYTRFLSPAVPSLILLALFAARWLLASFPRESRRLVAVLLLGVVVGTELAHIRSKAPHRVGEGEMVYPEAIAIADAHIPPGGLVFGMQLSGAYFFYREETMLRYDFISDEESRLVRARAAEENEPVHALVMDWEIPALRSRVPARWIPVAYARNVTLFELETSGR